jgi:very-short-patch-repair endonuclease
LRLGRSSAPPVRRAYGWSRQKKGPPGFDLDVSTGYWGSNRRSYADQEDDELANHVERVIPFVRDSRNALLVDPRPLGLARGGFLSLLYALKQGIQHEYQLEDSELAVVAMPSDEEPTHMLLYEASEGGAGVLRRLTDDPDALGRAARAALAACHFDPHTGADVAAVGGEVDVCGKACYDCLLSYTNQPHHEILDRHTIRDALLDLAGASVSRQTGALSRAEQLARLLASAEGFRGSTLEVRWLELVDRLDLRLPSGAQERIENLFVEPDFVYSEQKAVVFVDGPPHTSDGARSRDADADERLKRAGILPLRFPAYDGYSSDVEDAWKAVLAEHPSIFGPLREEGA